MKPRWARDFSIVPVVMFHSIGISGLKWTWSDMSEELDVFEGVLRGLADDGYTTIGLDALFHYMSGQGSLPERPVVLTFDDGYLDNWIYAVPLLRYYNMRATVYVTPEFVPDSEDVRPTAEIKDGRVARLDSHTVAGYMNWAELRAADSEGVLDVQSHALTHTWHFAGPNVVDVHRPSSIFKYPWMSWNVAPDRKPYYLTEDQQSFVPWGFPVFEHEKALITRRFLPDPSLTHSLCDFVAKNGGSGFFDAEDWRDRFDRTLNSIGDVSARGNFESDDDYIARVTDELATSKEIIESRLNKKVNYLAWPGGGVNDDIAAIARRVGYRSWTLSSWQQTSKRNLPGTDPEGIKRVTGRSKVHFRNRWIANGGAWWVLQRLYGHQGSLRAKLATGIAKLKWLLFGGKRRR